MTQSIVKKIKKLAIKHSVRVQFKNLKTAGGIAKCDKGIIVIGTGYTASTTTQIFYHELGHIHCYRMNKFSHYHRANATTKSGRTKFKRIALKAERFVDMWGCKEYYKNSYFSKKHKWEHHYRSKKEIKFLHDWMESWMKKCIM